MRASTSRPKLSVPNQWVALGGFNASRKLSAVGLWVKTNGPAIATTTVATSIVSPTASVRGNRRRRPGMTWLAPAISMSRRHRGAGARVEQGYQDVGEEVDEH